jgi:hypothetical protein
MASAPFWLALGCQIIIVFGYFWFYRKEQLCTCMSCVALHSLANRPFSSTMISVQTYTARSISRFLCIFCFVWALDAVSLPSVDWIVTLCRARSSNSHYAF